MSINSCGTCQHDIRREGKPACAVFQIVGDAVLERWRREPLDIAELRLSEEEKRERHAKFVEGVVPGYHAMQAWTEAQRWDGGFPVDPVESCPTWKERA